MYSRVPGATSPDVLLPLLPPYRPGRYDYYCASCTVRCTCKRLTVAEAISACREVYAATGDEVALRQLLAYVEYLPNSKD